MSNCTHVQTKISKALLNVLWVREVMNATVLFLKSKEQGGIYMQRNINDSTQGTYLELRTWFPYENSESSIPHESTVIVKVLTVRNLNDINRSDIFRGYNVMNFHGCPFKVL